MAFYVEKRLWNKKSMPNSLKCPSAGAQETIKNAYFTAGALQIQAESTKILLTGRGKIYLTWKTQKITNAY